MGFSAEEAEAGPPASKVAGRVGVWVDIVCSLRQLRFSCLF